MGNDFDALLLSSAPDILYLSGFTGEGLMVVRPNAPVTIITDGRYTFQAMEEAPGAQLLVTGNNQKTVSFIQECCAECRNLGLQKKHLTVSQFEEIQRTMPSVSFLSADEMLSGCREIKEEQEIALIHRAGEVADAAFQEFLCHPVCGFSERQLKNRLEQMLFDAGAEAMAFDTIVASGANAAKPHAVASDRIVKQGDVLLLDFGAVIQGYHSDVSRTLFVGTVDDRVMKAFDSVLAAKEAAAAKVSSGILCREADGYARDVLRENNLEEYFLHGLGHGVGLEIHEAPRVSSGAGDAVLKENSVITIEPGVYFEGHFGIRIEDTYLVKKTNCHPLTLSQCGPFVVK